MAQTYRKKEMAQNIVNKFFTSSMYELNVGNEQMEIIKGKLKENKTIDDSLFELICLEVKNNLKDSFKKFIKTEIFEVEFLKNRQQSFLRKKLGNVENKPSSSPELRGINGNSTTVEDYESKHMKKLQAMAEKIQTMPVAVRKKKTKTPVSNPSRKLSAEPYSDTNLDQYNFQNFSFGETDHSFGNSISFIMPGEKTNREIRSIKEEEKRRRKSSVQMFFGDLLKKISGKKEKPKPTKKSNSSTSSIISVESEAESEEEENIYKL
jgi:hypothetical protein